MPELERLTSFTPIRILGDYPSARLTEAGQAVSPTIRSKLDAIHRLAASLPGVGQAGAKRVVTMLEEAMDTGPTDALVEVITGALHDGEPAPIGAPGVHHPEVMPLPHPTDAEALRLGIESGAFIVVVRKLNGGGALGWNTRSFHYCRTVPPGEDVPEEWEREQRVTEAIETVHQTLSTFERLIWPQYCSDPLQVKLQASLRKIGATTYWNGHEWVIVVNPSGHPKDDLQLLLHDAIHARDHLSKESGVPDWALPSGQIDEQRLLELMHRRDLNRGYTYLKEREVQTDAEAEKELARFWSEK